MGGRLRGRLAGAALVGDHGSCLLVCVRLLAPRLLSAASATSPLDRQTTQVQGCERQRGPPVLAGLASSRKARELPLIGGASRLRDFSSPSLSRTCGSLRALLPLATDHHTTTLLLLTSLQLSNFLTLINLTSPHYFYKYCH